MSPAKCDRLSGPKIILRPVKDLRDAKDLKKVKILQLSGALNDKSHIMIMFTTGPDKPIGDMKLE